MSGKEKTEKSDEQKTDSTDVQPGNIKAIESVDDLAAAYPDLVAEIRDRAKTEALSATNKPPSLKVPGFLLDIDDPFAEGAARAFGTAKGITAPRLPCVLPYKDAASAKALKSYILRANGGGDTKRAGKAAAALEKIKS